MSLFTPKITGNGHEDNMMLGLGQWNINAPDQMGLNLQWEKLVGIHKSGHHTKLSAKGTQSSLTQLWLYSSSILHRFICLSVKVIHLKDLFLSDL